MFPCKLNETFAPVWTARKKADDQLAERFAIYRAKSGDQGNLANRCETEGWHRQKSLVTTAINTYACTWPKRIIEFIDLERR
jgi:hypothetical protein